MEKISFQDKYNNINEAAFAIFKQNLDSGKHIDFKVADIGKSMFPLLDAGDAVSVGAINPNKISRGDIVIFRKQGNLCMHRYIRKISNGGIAKFVMKGDNVLEIDQPAVYAENILGRAVRIRKQCNNINMDSWFWKIGNFIIAVVTIFQVIIIRIAAPIAKSNKKVFFNFTAKNFLMFPSHCLVRLMLFCNKTSLKFYQKIPGV